MKRLSKKRNKRVQQIVIVLLFYKHCWRIHLISSFNSLGKILNTATNKNLVQFLQTMSIFTVQDKVIVPMQLYVVAVTLIAIVPRMPFDKPFTIGGELSHNYRKLLLALSCLYIIRTTIRSLIVEYATKGFYLLLKAIEGDLHSVLSLLTPYLLRLWMSDRINLPGGRKPGKALEPWIYAVIGLSLFACCANIYTGDDIWWIWKKIADVLSFFPVRQTIIWYNSLTTGQAKYPNRGNVLSQILMVSEYYSVISCLGDIAAKSLVILNIMDESWIGRPFVQGIYINVLFATYTRILCHSIMLNFLDEQSHFVVTPPDDPDNESPTSTDESPRKNALIAVMPK